MKNGMNAAGWLAAAELALIFSPTLVDAASTGATGASSTSDSLEEIVVTAEKREENIQDVPISVIAVSQTQLKNAGVTDFVTLSQAVSGLQVTDSNSYVFAILRGIGSFVQGNASFSSVSTYVDGVYVPFENSTEMALYNVQSIEILKGPQSTLYGRNATGGAITITTKTAMPGDPLSGNVSLTQGNYDTQIASGFISSGLGDKFAVNLAADYDYHHGYVKNLATSNFFAQPGPADIQEPARGKDLDALNSYATQLKFTYVPEDATKITLALIRSEADDTMGSGNTQLNPAGADAVLTRLLGPGNYKFATQFGTGYGWSNVRVNLEEGANLTATHDTNDLLFTNIAAVHLSRGGGTTDILSASFPTLGFTGKESEIEYFSEEFRINSKGNNRFNWLVGANFFGEHSDPTVATYNLEFGAVFPNSIAQFRNNSTAPFAEVYYDITDKLKLTAGARLTLEKDRVTEIFNSTGTPPGTVATKTNDTPTYRGVLDYKTPWGLVYGSVSTGLKSGAVNVALLSSSFEPEKIIAYEVGEKSEFLDKRLRVNAAAFTYDFTDIQAQIIGGPGGGATYYVNGKSARLSGAEAELEARAGDLSAHAGVTYLFKRTYTNFNFPANPIVEIPALNVTGNDMVGAPQTSLVLGGRYELNAGDAGQFALNANLDYNTGYYFDIQNDVGTGGYRDASHVTLVNSSLDYSTSGGAYGLSLWVHNMTNQEYYRAGISALAGATVEGLAGNPRTYGVTGTWKF